MTGSGESPIRLQEGRFARFEAIEWWDQALLQGARVVVVGAGALGNEVIKNLALLGVGHLVVVDRDRVEASNLSRSVLFREADAGQPKAVCAARGAESLYPGVHVTPLVGDVLADVGLGYFRWAQVVVGALDNREARVFVNGACARVGRPWLDGGIEVLHGVVRGFAPPATACYECTMSQVDWDLLSQRRSCSLLARRALSARGTPTTPTTASVIGGIQAQEVVKLLHGMDALMGRGFVFDGEGHTSQPVRYPISPECDWHGPAAPIEAAQDLNWDTPLGAIWERAARRLGAVDAIDLGRELVDVLECPSCGASQRVLKPAESVGEDEAVCKQCETELVPRFLHTIGGECELLNRTVRQMGLPAWEIVWARRGTSLLGLEMTGDKALGALS